MYKEYYKINKYALDLIRDTKKAGRTVICVGTTTVRVLETLVDIITHEDSATSDYEGYTDLFIYPGYEFKIVDGLVTNFHLPKSSLLMLVAAFAGRDRLFHAYGEAIKENYRFYSYGDAMFIN